VLLSQLLINGLVTGCILGLIAISWALIYSTAGIFHVAHAGIYTLGGYLAWSLVTHGVPTLPAFIIAIAICALVGAAIQTQLYNRLADRQATPLVILVASLGTLAIIQNTIAMIYTTNILQFPLGWNRAVIGIANNSIRLSYPQILTLFAGAALCLGTICFTRYTGLGKRIRAVANNPFLADITRLRPRQTYTYVMAIASGMVGLCGILVSLDFGLQPYNGVLPLMTATVAVFAGGIGSTLGAFAVALILSVLENLALLVMPGEWGVAIAFGIFIVFMLFLPTGLSSLYSRR
jgi:branched-chain amino acid transport system permease protein